MKRKVIKQANSAYTLTLPIAWVRENKISEISEVDVVGEGRQLVISNGSFVQVLKGSFNAEGLTRRELYQRVNAFYARGYDEIKVHSTKDISSDLVRVMNSVVGFALVSQEGDSYVLKDIGGTGNVDLNEIFKRVFQSVLLFYESAIQDVFGSLNETEDGLKVRDREVNKLCLYLQRAVNKMAALDAISGRILFTYSFELERIGDDILRFWRESIQRKSSPKSLLSAAKNSLKCLELAFDSYYFGKDVSNELYFARQKVRRGVFDKKSLGIGEYILKIAEGASDLGHLNLMRNLK